MCMYFMNKSFRLLEDATQLGYNKTLLRHQFARCSFCPDFIWPQMFSYSVQNLENQGIWDAVVVQPAWCAP